eukprot:3205751-Karenia_brevis.AAC.1
MQHTGEALDANAAALLRTLERGVCTGPECGGLRRIEVRHCYRCGHATAVRPPRAGSSDWHGEHSEVDPLTGM